MSTFFRQLEDNEKSDFIQWAKDNTTPEHLAKADIYHPLVRQTWLEMGLIKDANSPMDNITLDVDSAIEAILNITFEV